MAFFRQYLTADEEAQIHQQFQGDIWRRNNQVLWSGILRDEAQRWADEHEMQTLTTAMGPLMDSSHPLCLRNKKSIKAWRQYIKGASAIFAWYISRGEKVTVLSPPPPERFHPSGATSYQAIEEPIIRGKLETRTVSRIEMVHPTVKGAENTHYQIWPVDETTTWTAKFGELNVQKRCWRVVKKRLLISTALNIRQFLLIGRSKREKRNIAKKEKKKEQKGSEEKKVAKEEKKREKEKVKLKQEREKLEQRVTLAMAGERPSLSKLIFQLLHALFITLIMLPHTLVKLLVQRRDEIDRKAADFEAVRGQLSTAVKERDKRIETQSDELVELNERYDMLERAKNSIGKEILKRKAELELVKRSLH
ncbi:hypothetical protein LSUB1_G005285, partial [Lachnellula subtilissima]